MFQLLATVREVNAWNVGVMLAALCLICWWRSDGKFVWRKWRSLCQGCGRRYDNCACTGVTFTFEGEDDDE